MKVNNKISIKEKIGYALGDGAANIAWRGAATFLFIFYTDVFGLSPVTVGVLFLVARFGDGISDFLMEIIGDQTKSKYGKFRPWILRTAILHGVILSLLFTSPELGENGKIAYAYITYVIFTLLYTANKVPYGALMAVMTGNDKERTSIGSFRMVGAFTGGMLAQGALLFLFQLGIAMICFRGSYVFKAALPPGIPGVGFFSIAWPIKLIRIKYI